MAITIDLGERLIRLADRVLSRNTNETVGHTGGITNNTATDTSVPTTKAVKDYVDAQEHGQIKNNGAIGTVANKPIITTNNGVLTTGAFGTTANTFAEGNHTHSQYLTEHQDISGKANKNELSTVATTGSYNDLTNQPFIPTKTSDLTNDNNYVQSSAFSWTRVTGSRLGSNRNGVTLYENDFFCCLVIDLNEQMNLDKTSDYGIQSGYISDVNIRPKKAVTTVCEEGNGGREVLVTLKPNGNLMARSLHATYGQNTYIIRCTLLWPKNLP